MAGDKRYKKTVVDLLTRQDITDDVILEGNQVNGFDYTDMCLLVDIESTGNPTNIRVYIQTSPDFGQTWYTLQNDFLATLIWDNECCATRQYEAYDFVCPGGETRVCVHGDGCDNNNYFTVGLKAFLRTE